MVTVSACTPPVITDRTSNRTIEFGQVTQLSVTATGSPLLHYQWFIGNPGDTSQPTGTDNRILSVSPTVTTTYWARVTGPCGPPADSGGIVVSVEACPSVTVGTPTATPSGASVILDVSATSLGQTLTYEWFRGNTPGSGGTLVGNAKSITVPVTELRLYWVRVKNGCNAQAVSAVITVAPCTLPGILTQPVDQTIATGTATTVSLVLTSDAGNTVTWYRRALRLTKRTRSASARASPQVLSYRPVHSGPPWPIRAGKCRPVPRSSR